MFQSEMKVGKHITLRYGIVQNKIGTEVLYKYKLFINNHQMPRKTPRSECFEGPLVPEWSDAIDDLFENIEQFLYAYKEE